AALGHGGVNYLPGDPLVDQMFLTDGEQDAYAAGGNWHTKFDPGDIFNKAPLVWWYLALQLMVIPAIPLAFPIFRAFPAHGWAMAEVLGRLLVSWRAWLFASMEFLRFEPLSIFLAWFMLLLAGVLVGRNHLASLPGALKLRWRWIVATESLFLAA